MELKDDSGNRALTPISSEQLVYARWLKWGTRVALAALVSLYAVYALRIVEPFVPLEELPRLWSLHADAYLAATGSPSSWHWLPLIGKADYLNLAAIALLCFVTVLCYLRLAALYVERGERLLALIASLQVLVLVAAATGWLAAAH